MLFPPTRFRLQAVDQCGSTNEVLLSMRQAPSFPGHALLAHKQTAGRGRRGRDWESGTGNLALSVAMRLPADAPTPALLPFLAGLALHEQVAKSLPRGADLRLKWPNDLYLNGKKLAGMLAQARTGEGVTDVVLGIGANLKHAPAELSDTAIALSEFGLAPDPESFALGFLMRFEKVLKDAVDFAWLKDAWEAKAKLSDSDYRIVGEEEVVTALGLLPSGELEVTTAAGVKRALSSEEVSLRLEG